MIRSTTGKPEVLLRHRSGRKKVSFVLIDWGVRESFHSVEYLNRQTAPRDDFELIWVEFYGRKPAELARMAATPGRPMIDQWVVLGYPEDLIYHKHRAYNAGLVAATGDIVVVCDSDAMFRPTFVENLLKAFDETSYAVVHVDEVRNVSPDYYPFNYPTFEQVMGEGSINWFEVTTRGLYLPDDRLHNANYGACFAARRNEVLAIGGADEHFDYLGFCCGPYEMTFRLQNRGRRERWITSEYLYHTWHPNQTSYNADYQGPHDGRYLSLRALHARSTGRVKPYLANPFVNRGARDRLPEFLDFVAEHPEPEWRADSLPTAPPDFVYQIDADYRGFDVYMHRGEWVAVPVGCGGYDPDREYAVCLRGHDEASIRAQMWAATPEYAGPRPAGRVKKLVSSLMCEPLHTLPRRAWRAARRKLLKSKG